MAIIGALAKGLVRGGGRAAASKIMGRKKTVKVNDIKPQTAIVPSPSQEKTGGALVKSPTAAITKAMKPIQQVSTGAVAKDDYLGVISEKLLIIEQIVLSVYQAESLNLMQKKQDDKDDARKNQEQKLETDGKKPDTKKPKLADLPKVGVFGWLKRFIGNILMGLFLMKMVEYADLLPGIIRTIDGITTFLADWGGKIVGALITFADFGIKAYNFTIGVIEKGLGPLFGENSSKVLGLIENAIFLTTAIAGSMAAEAMMGGGGGGPTTGIRGAAGQAGRVAGAQTTTAAAARRYAARFGRDAAVQRFGAEAVKSLGGKYGRSQVTNLGRNVAVRVLGKRGAAKAIKTAAGILKPLVKNIPLIGGITEFILSWISGDPIGKAAFKGIGTGLGTWIGGALGSLIPIPGVGTAIGMFLGGTGGSALGGVIYDAIFGGKKPKPTTESVDNFYSEFQEGGEVERPQKTVKRGIDIKKKRPDRKRVPKPTKDEIKLTPKNVNDGKQKKENDRAWWDFLGWAGTGSSEGKELGPGGKTLAEKVTKVGNQLGDNDYFGPILRLTSKVILDQEVTSKDYINVGKGINLLLDDGMRKGAIGLMAYNEGGAVENLPQLDVTDWVKKNFETGLSDSLKKKYVNFGTTAGPGTAAGERDPATGEMTPGTQTGTAPSSPSTGASTGATSSRFGTAEQKKMLDAIAFAEGTTGSYGTLYGGRVIDELAAGEMTIAEVLKMQKSKMYKGESVYGSGYDSNATGRYQFMSYVLEEEIGKQGVDPSEKFTPEMQDRLILNRISRMRGVTPELLAAEGMSDKVIDMLAPEFASFPNLIGPDAQGRVGTNTSYYGQGGKSAAEIKKAYGDSTGESSAIEMADTQVQPPSLPDEPGSADVSGGEDIKVSGSGIVNIGKDLISKGFSVAEHPDFTKTPTASGGTYTPGKGTVSRVHKGAGHYEGRAIDVTDWRGSLQDSQARYRSVLDSLQNNPAINMLIHDTWGGMYSPGQKQGPGGHGHPTHMHIEVKDKGGFIGKGLFANLGGTEFVTDADSTSALKQAAPGLMMALNQASDKSGIESVLKQYASYEQGAGQTVIVQQDEGGQEVPQGAYGTMPSTSKTPPMILDSSNPFEFLEYQG